MYADSELHGERLGDLVIAAGQIRNPKEPCLPRTASHGAQQHKVTPY